MHALNSKIQFDKTFNHLSKERPIHPSKVALLITIPLTSQKHKKEKKQYKWLKRMRGRLPHDFVMNWENENWDIYQEQVVTAIKHILKELEQTQPEIILRIHTNYNQFKKCLSSSQFDVIYLAAHHIETASAIEFSDGGVPYNQFKKDIQKIKRGSPINLINAICNSSNIELDCYGLDQIQSLGSANWNVPVVGAIQFFAYWMQMLDGTTTLSDAYEKALDLLYRNHS